METVTQTDRLVLLGTSEHLLNALQLGYLLQTTLHTHSFFPMISQIIEEILDQT